MGKPEDWSELETYNNDQEEPVKKKGFFGRLLDKTVIPEKIERMKEEKALKKQIQHEAKIEAMSEVKDDIKEILKQKYKQEEIDKITGAGREKKMQKFANAFKMPSGEGSFNVGSGGESSGGGLGSSEHINRMLGIKPPQPIQPTQRKKTKKKKGKKKTTKTKPPQQKNPFDVEDKIKRMLE